MIAQASNAVPVFTTSSTLVPFYCTCCSRIFRSSSNLLHHKDLWQNKGTSRILSGIFESFPGYILLLQDGYACLQLENILFGLFQLNINPLVLFFLIKKNFFVLPLNSVFHQGFFFPSLISQWQVLDNDQPLCTSYILYILNFLHLFLFQWYSANWMFHNIKNTCHLWLRSYGVTSPKASSFSLTALITASAMVSLCVGLWIFDLKRVFMYYLGYSLTQPSSPHIILGFTAFTISSTTGDILRFNLWEKI